MLRDQLDELMAKFKFAVDDIYAVYLDAFRGFSVNRQQLLDMQTESLKRLSNTNPENANMEYLDQTPLVHAKEVGTPPSRSVLLVTSQGQFKDRNSEQGKNYETLGNLCLVAIYSLWEETYRIQIARLLGISKDDIRYPVMGDIRLLRHAVVHNQSIVDSDKSRFQKLKFFERGQKVTLSFEHFEVLYTQVVLGLEELFRDLDPK